MDNLPGRKDRKPSVIEMDFADIENRIIASMLSPRGDIHFADLLAASDHKAETSVVSESTPTLTLEMLEEMVAAADRENQKLMEQEIEAFFAAGCKVVINEFVPDGKLLILPKDYSEALERVLKRMRATAQASAYDLFYGSHRAYYNPEPVS